MCAKFKVCMSCEEVNEICDKAQYCEASFWEKVTLYLHVIRCKGCRNYTKNNTKLTKIVKTSKLDCLDKSSKEHMKTRLEKAMKDRSV